MPASNIPTTVYVVTTWVNDETPLSSTNMNHIEEGLLLTSQRSIANHNNIELILEALTSLFSVSFSNETFTISFGNNETFPFRVSKTVEINTHTTEIETIAQFLDDHFDETKTGYIKNAVHSNSAKTDEDGNDIRETYATKEELSESNTEIENVKDGVTPVGKSINDEDGNRIKLTYSKIQDIVNTLNDTSTNKALSAYQGKLLQDQITSIQNILQSDDTNLDELQEIVTYIKGNKSLIDSITLAKISYTDIITNYTSNITNKPVSASVAYALKILIDNIVNGTTKVKKAEVADKVGDTSEEEIVKSVNGNTPTNGNVNVAGFVSFTTKESGDDILLKVNYQGDIGGTFSLVDDGDYKYVVFTPTGD